MENQKAKSRHRSADDEMHDLLCGARRSAAKAGSLIRKLSGVTSDAKYPGYLESLELHVAELKRIRNELADRTGRSALE
ncbi:hypothetical protein [Pseudomonas oryzihabitans]|uniref:hypothetical protein n=1 Tax=Pseudomonas oryzihabitans TaxID=47885 RepID=UPI002894211D|nr:hypothetical protein [Pseudomonas oryzihabitans]MDT3722863.1 hypothetical protein [Pseudomonas oryzihabitans]